MRINCTASRHFICREVRSRRQPSKQHGPTVVEPVSFRAPAKASDRFLELSHGSDNAVNSAFADFLLGIRENDEVRQQEAYEVLIRIARSAAQAVGGYVLHSADWQEVANNCIHQQSRKHRELTSDEIAEWCKSKKFTYLWKAFKADFVDETRKLKRRAKTIDDATALSEPSSRRNDYLDHTEYEWIADQCQSAGQSLPVGAAAIAEAIGDLYRNPGQLLELASPKLSETSCKTSFMEYVAKRRGVDTQVVRRDLRRFKDCANSRERISEILRNASLSSYHEHEQFVTDSAIPEECSEEDGKHA